MYLLYPMTVGGYAIFQIPSGQTAEELATSFGLTMAQCAEFDMATFGAAAALYPYNFTLVDNQPLPNGAAFDLPAAKVTASSQAKSETSTQQQTVLAGYTPEAIAGQAALAIGSRIPAIQAVIVATNALSDTLETNLAAIAAATTIDEVNNIVNPPTGILSTGRGGDGDGPLDLNNSVYTEFNSVSLTEAETELYIPGTDIVITYGAVVPNGFTSNGNCFTLGDYRVQIREVATSQVIAEFECPLATVANVDVAF